MTLPGVIASGTAGAMVGNLFWYLVARWVGFKRFCPFIERHGRWLHLSAERLDRAERWFDRWEEWAVFIGRVTPVVRSFISVPAGVFNAHFRPYFWLTLLGSAIWCFAFAGAGWAAGSNWESFHEAFRYVDYLVAAGVVAGAAWLGWRLVKRRRRPADEPV